MFKKSNSGADAFANRLKRVADQPAAAYDPAPARASSQRAPRQNLFKRGVLNVNGGPNIPVAIKNLSATGAQVEFVERSALPAEVILVEPLSELRRRARVVWQREGAAGLEFI